MKAVAAAVSDVRTARPADATVIDLIRRAQGRQAWPKPVRWVVQPLLKAVRDCGTVHFYADTADPTELRDLLVAREDGEAVHMYGEVDGNTTNQPLIEKVLDRLLSADETDGIVAWARRLREVDPGLTLEEGTVLVYSILNGRLAWEVLDRFGAGRTWHISLELHTALAPDPVASRRVARALSRAVPGALVKVAFTPDHPHALLIARDLEREGVAVNFTATFSARQVVAAALLANPHRTNIFLGRLNQGLRLDLLGEHVLLEAQRHMRRLRRDFGVRTLNMAASVRRWQTMVLTAGCDAYTVPYPVLKAFLTQGEVGPEAVCDCQEMDFTEAVRALPAEVVEKVGGFERVERLWKVEPEFIEFLVELRSDPAFDRLDGEGLFRRFEAAGFGDFFYAPTAAEWRELRKNKLPDLDSPLTRRIALDTLYSLLAVGDFANFQDQMDARIRAILEPQWASPGG